MKSQIQSKYLKAHKIYQRLGFKWKINLNDYILIPRERNKLIGVLRICEEEEFLVIKEMFDGNAYRRQTNTSELQKELEEQLQGRALYCIPNVNLKAYYKQLGFMPIELNKVPIFFKNKFMLKKRRDKFSKKKINRIIMKKPKVDKE